MLHKNLRMNVLKTSFLLYEPSPTGKTFRKLCTTTEDVKNFWKLLEIIYCSVTQPWPTLVTPGSAACQASLSFIIYQSLFRLMSIESAIPSNYLILCYPLLLLPSIFPSIRIFSNESTLHIRWPKYWSFSFSISPSNEYLGFISFRID